MSAYYASKLAGQDVGTIPIIIAIGAVAIILIAMLKKPKE